MNELIKIEKSNVGGDLIETVNARELHSFLEVQTRYNDWIIRRISEYGFVEESDFYSFLSESSGGRPSKEYAISIGMAKELAMVERNEKGRKARQYFIECEKRLKQVTNQPVPLLSEYEKDLKVIGVIAEVLRVSESSKLGMVKTYCEKHVSRVAPLLPSYAVDSPAGSTAGSIGSSEPTIPISNVVEGIMSAAKANKALDKAGLLEQRFRKSSNGEKAFWSVTEKGLNYGKNITSPHNQRETQPHWYVSKKEDLVNIIKNNMQ